MSAWSHLGTGAGDFTATARPALDTIEPIPSTTLLSAQEAKDRLREIVEGFFFQRLRAGDARRVGRLLVKSPPGLGKTRETIHWAMCYQAEQEGKDGTRLLVGDFNEAALKQFGSGWAWLILDGAAVKIESTPNQDTPLGSGQIPLLGIDVWEHAYYLKHQNKRVDYITAWWNVVNWDFAVARFNAGSKLSA